MKHLFWYNASGSTQRYNLEIVVTRILVEGRISEGFIKQVTICSL